MFFFNDVNAAIFNGPNFIYSFKYNCDKNNFIYHKKSFSEFSNNIIQFYR